MLNDHAVKAFVIFGVVWEVLESSQIVSNGEVSAGLNAREDNLLIV